jgi:carbon starvation protein
MLTAATWVKNAQKASTGMLAAVLIPAFFLWITVFSALIWFLVKVVPATTPVLQVILGGFVVIMLVLDVFLVINFFKNYNQGKKATAKA